MIYTQESQTFDAERKGHLGSTGPEGVFPLVSPCLAGCGWELQGKGRACQGRAGYAGQVWGLTFHCSSGGRWRERGRLSCILRLRTEQMCFQGEEIRLLFPRKYLGREIRAQPFKLNSLPTSLEPKKKLFERNWKSVGNRNAPHKTQICSVSQVVSLRDADVLGLSRRDGYIRGRPLPVSPGAVERNME